MKKIISFLFLIMILVFPLSVSAHVLKTDNFIGGILHINPDDDPIAGTVSDIYLDLKDNSGKVTISDCDCYLNIYNNNQKLYSQNLFLNSQNLNSVYHQFTFPEKGVYQIEITGQSLSNSFSNFNLKYDIRVDKEILNQSDPKNIKDSYFNNRYIIIGAILIAIIIVFTMFKVLKKGDFK